jgi:hypothetical protein
MKLIIFFTLNSKSFVFEFLSRLSVHERLDSKVASIANRFGGCYLGPRGAYLSKPLLKHHWGTPPVYLARRTASELFLKQVGLVRITGKMNSRSTPTSGRT